MRIFAVFERQEGRVIDKGIGSSVQGGNRVASPPALPFQRPGEGPHLGGLLLPFHFPSLSSSFRICERSLEPVPLIFKTDSAPRPLHRPRPAQNSWKQRRHA